MLEKRKTRNSSESRIRHTTGKVKPPTIREPKAEPNNKPSELDTPSMVLYERRVSLARKVPVMVPIKERFRLQRADGMFLHFAGVAFTNNLAYAGWWIERQLASILKQHPELKPIRFDLAGKEE